MIQFKKINSIQQQDGFQYFISNFMSQIENQVAQNQYMLQTEIKNSSMALYDTKLSRHPQRFFQKFCKCLQITKKCITTIFYSFHSPFQFISHKTLIQDTIKNLQILTNTDMKYLLETGIIQCYAFFMKISMELSTNSSNQQIREIFLKTIRNFSGLLHYTILYKQYNTRKMIADKSHTTKSKYFQNNDFDMELLQQIELDISKQEIYQLIKQYIKWQQQKIQSIQEICRICQCKIKVDFIEEHVDYCTWKHKYLQKLDSNKVQMTELVSQIRLREVQLAIQLKKKRKNAHINNKSQNIQQLRHNKSTKSFKSQNKISSLKQIIQFSSPNNYIKFFYQIYKLVIKYLETLMSLRSNTITRQLQILSSQLHKQFKQVNMNLLTNYQPLLAKFYQTFNKRFLLQNQLKKKQCQYIKIYQNIYNIPMKNSLQKFNYSLLTQQMKHKCKNSQKKFKSVIAKCQIINSQELISDTQPALQIKITQNKKIIKKHSFQQIQHSFLSLDSEQQQKIECASQKYLRTQNSKKVSFKDFRILKFLGKGAFGKVYLVRRFLTNDNYAMKVIKINQNGLEEKKKIEDIRNQHDIFRKISGDFLVKAAFSFTQGNIHMFFLQYMKGGDFSQLLEEQVYLDQKTAQFYLAEIVLAIQHLHKLNIIHRDLKPQNLVIDQKGHLKLTDFGLSKQGISKKIQKTQQQNKYQTQYMTQLKILKRRTLLQTGKQKFKILGTPDYIAPEIIKRVSADNETIDWWSLGVIIYQVLVGQKPFGAQTIQKVFDNIINMNIQWPNIGYQQGMMTPEAQNLIQKLLDMDYNTRLGVKGAYEIKNHPFFAGVNWNTIKNQTPPLSKIPNQLRINEQNTQLRNQIQGLIGKNYQSKSKLNLNDLVRFDLLSEQTLKSGKVTKQKKVEKLKLTQHQLAEITNVASKLSPRRFCFKQINSDRINNLMQC